MGDKGIAPFGWVIGRNGGNQLPKQGFIYLSRFLFFWHIPSFFLFLSLFLSFFRLYLFPSPLYFQSVLSYLSYHLIYFKIYLIYRAFLISHEAASRFDAKEPKAGPRRSCSTPGWGAPRTLRSLDLQKPIGRRDEKTAKSQKRNKHVVLVSFFFSA